MLTKHETIKVFSFLPLAAILIPIAVAGVIAMLDESREKLRNIIAVASTIATLGVIFAIARNVFGGHELYFEVELSRIPGFSIKLSADGINTVFSLVAGVLWVLATLHGAQYMSHEEKKRRFFTFLTLAEAFALGVFMVSDFLSLFIFFELMGLSAYFLIVHSETEAARKAAAKYLFMTVTGGLILLMGIFLYAKYSETVGFIPMEHSAFLGNYPLKTLTLICLIAGFGVKAGMVPFHVWLPDAHPVAPSPASALLSGVMIKTGAYGIIRTVATFFYQPASQGAGASTGELGFILVWLALITMFTGMVLAVLQNDLKRTLAYSSISQMGFILLGVGSLGCLEAAGAIGLAGSIYHVINHALFKACFFLTAGSILFRTHELNIYKLGGLAKKMPWSTVFWCIAALGIAGVPLFNGFISKTFLHHALLEMGHVSEEAFWYDAAEIMFVISSAGTVLYFLKITYFTFFRKSSEHGNHHEEIKEAPGLMLLSCGVLAVLAMLTGLFPQVIFKNLLLPGIETLKRLEPETIEHLTQLNFFAPENIRAVILPISLGIAAFFILMVTGLFETNREKAGLGLLGLPSWVGIDGMYLAAARAFVSACFVSQQLCHSLQGYLVTSSVKGFGSMREAWGKAGRILNNTGALVRRKTINSLNIFNSVLSPVLGSTVDDIAFGTLVIVIILALFLTLKLFTPL